ncbi:unnamed protein product (macronuclear) [Paramecium tetraurelia]|uniref:Transmembrane protein n=1 Tax=Paramecium tetraurelia TaxID=5888 RepID=A0BY67_PARTE|nr:uncharacterized protein GSPATT00033337001 [Paramecium tetraurelia]CAK63484.1 unnamed protein product [Paramecium tetraurelia]|eukprot:XP_001430882.1 hypothetical protein (macronuclear) [Paramecium tetraurelia strain d4-2]
MILTQIITLIIYKYQYFIANIANIDSQHQSQEEQILKYIVYPIYLINVSLLIQSICLIQIPIIDQIINNVLLQSSPYVVLNINFIILFILIAFILTDNMNQNCITILRLILKNYDKICLIPFQIITLNYMSSQIEQTIVQVINTIIIYLFSLNQNYYFQPINFLPNNANRVFTKFQVIKPLVIQQILIFQQYFHINLYLQYFLLFHWLCAFIEMMMEVLQYHNGFIIYESNIHSFSISLTSIGIYQSYQPQNKTLLYSFLFIFSFTLNIAILIQNRIVSIMKSQANTMTFCQLYHFTYVQHIHDPYELLQFKIYQQIHSQNCNELKCSCKKNKTITSDVDLQKIISICFRNLIANLKNEMLIMYYISYLHEVTHNLIQAYQLILAHKFSIQNYYYQTILQMLETTIQIQINKQLSQLDNRNNFIEEIKLLKYDGIIIQTELQKIVEQKILLNVGLKEGRIINFQQLYYKLLSLRQMTANVIKLSKNMKIYQNNKTNNIFSLRISLLLSYLTQNLREQYEIYCKINELIQSEIYQEEDFFTNISFSSNNGIYLTAAFKENGQVTQMLTTRQKKFLDLDDNFELTHISQLLHLSLGLVIGKSKFIGKQIDTTISLPNKNLMQIKLILQPYFPSQKLNYFQLIAFICKNEIGNHAIIHLDLSFNIMSVNKTFQRFLDQYQLTVNKINIFKMIPTLKESLIKFHSQTNESKSIYVQNQIIQVSNCYSNNTNSANYNIQKSLNQNQQSKLINSLTSQTEQSTINDDTKQIDYEISMCVIHYEFEEEKEYYIYYKLIIDLAQIHQDHKLDQTHCVSQDKKERREHMQQMSKSKSQGKHDLLRSLHSQTSTTSAIKQGDQLLQQISSSSLPSCIINFLLVSTLNVIISIASMIIIYLLLISKRSQQDVCFDRLFYGTEFLDYYGLILKGSRHTVFYRDFHKVVKDEQKIELMQDSASVVITDKITLSLNLYQKNCQQLINLYENYIKYLDSYQEQKSISFKYVDYFITKTKVQEVETQAKYYEMMNQLFYLAIKTFAGDPSNYLTGSEDTFPQINTRSILFLNFNDVCDLTAQFIESCLQNSKEYNNQFDNEVQVIFITIYMILFILFVLLLCLLMSIVKKLRQILQVYLRLDNRDLDSDIEILQNIIENIKIEEFWFNTKFFNQFYEKSQETSFPIEPQLKNTNLKLEDKFNIGYYQILQILVFVFIFLFLLIFQLQYISYSNEINPIVNQALSAVQIRLNFIELINNWDVYNHKMFYQTFYNNEKENNIMNQNIKSDYSIFSLIEINETKLNNSISHAQQEPFTNVTENLNDYQKESLLIKDICLVFDCSMKNDIFENRLLSDHLENYFSVGLIQLYQQTISVVNNLGLINNTHQNNYFLDQLYSKEYFVYIFWGLDATNYQIKLFSDFFISLAKEKLNLETRFILYLLIGLGIMIQLLIVVLSCGLGYLVINNYNNLKYCLRFIPLKTLIQKNIIKQIKLII